MSNVDSTIPAGFRQIPDFPRYAINKEGTIVLSICRGGKGANREWNNAKRLSLAISSSTGYLTCGPCGGNGRARTFAIHRLVLATFVGPCPDGMECRHIDGNKLNNHVSNLAWGTPSENQNDRKLHGTDSIGEKNSKAKPTDDAVREIRTRYGRGERQQTIADEFQVSKSLISLVVLRRIWKHLP